MLWVKVQKNIRCLPPCPSPTHLHGNEKKKTTGLQSLADAVIIYSLQKTSNRQLFATACTLLSMFSPSFMSVVLQYNYYASFAAALSPHPRYNQGQWSACIVEGSSQPLLAVTVANRTVSSAYFDKHLDTFYVAQRENLDASCAEMGGGVLPAKAINSKYQKCHARMARWINEGSLK